MPVRSCGMIENKEESARGRTRERVIVLTALFAILFLFAFFLKYILIPFIRLELHHDLDGAEELLRSRGLLGFLTVTLVEALQMVVVFIPAEFIQISSGLSYPVYVSLPLCDLGVCLGATIIFVLVRMFRFHNTAFEKSRKKIDRLSLSVHHRNTVLFLYLLFFMPIIPFGAICYYGSSTRLPYKKYIRTVATGVVPSILVSNLMGEAGKAFLIRSIPLWILIVIIVLLAILLFALIFFFLDRFCFRENDGTPDSLVYAMLFFIVKIWQGKKQRVTLEDEPLHHLEAPYFLLANHESFFDFYYIYQMAHPRNPTFLVNEYYTTRPVLKYLAKKAGILSKKLFTPDMPSAVSIMRAIRKGYPVVIFPEGRLSPDGRSNPIVEPGAAFYKKLGVDLVLTRIHGAYFSKPKWRKKAYRSDIRVTVERVVKRQELLTMSEAELNELIVSSLYNDASEKPLTAYRQKDRAKGLENILYRCSDCGGLYTTETAGCTLFCKVCGAVHRLDEHYFFTDGIRTIPRYYDRIKALERKNLASFSLNASVRTKIHGAKGGPIRKEKGVCSLNAHGFTYRSESVSFAVPIEKLPALAFSCGEEFELYYRDELYYFYPEENRQQVARWAMMTDLLWERSRNTTCV